MMSKAALTAATVLLAVALFAGVARAAGPVSVSPSATLGVELGWGGRVRAGRWVPVTLTLSASQTRAVVVEVYAPQGGSYGMRVRQFVTIGPISTTFQVYIPLYPGDGPAVVVKDADNGKTLVTYPDDRDGSSRIYDHLVSRESRLVGVSGSRTSLQGLNGRIGGTPVDVAPVDPALLPGTPVGYDSLDLLVLNRPNLLGLDVGRQQAVLDWVRAGGNLLLWPGDGPAPEAAPLVQALPCDVGDLTDFPLDDATKIKLGLAARVTSLRGRKLSPREGAWPVDFLPPSAPRAYGRRYGLGQIVVVPFDLGAAQTSGAGAGGDVWTPLVTGMGLLKGEAGQSNVGDSFTDPDLQRQELALRSVQNQMGNIPGLGQFGFSYLATVLIGMMVVVGPVDWFVLRKLGRQPWTWVTTSGWIALVTLGAVYIGYVFKSGDLHYRTVRVVDQIDDGTVGEADLALVYAPRTAEYRLTAPPAATSGGAAGAPPAGPPAPAPGWWRPAALDHWQRGGPTADTDFHQVDRADGGGNAPEPMLINVWNLRFLAADQTAAGPAVVDAKLDWVPARAGPDDRNGEYPRIVGTLKNLTGKPLANVRIRTLAGFAVGPPGQATTGPGRLLPRLEPGAPAAVDSSVAGTPDLPTPDRSYHYSRYGYEEASVVSDDLLWRVAGDLSGRRARRADLLMGTGRWAVVYAEVADPDPPAVLAEPDARQRHYELIRAVVPIGGPWPAQLGLDPGGFGVKSGPMPTPQPAEKPTPSRGSAVD